MRQLPRIKRSTWKGRTPRTGLALSMLSQTSIVVAATVTGSAAVPVGVRRGEQTGSKEPGAPHSHQS